MPDLSVEMLRQILDLDAETGRVSWRQREEASFTGVLNPTQACATWNAQRAGKEAFTYIEPNTGRRRGSVSNRLYVKSRVVFALANGRWPDGEVDHKDGDILNDRPENLREATRSQNEWNKRSYLGSSSSYKGVGWHKQSKKWRAFAGLNGKTLHLGMFDCEIDAARAYNAFALEHHGEFARLNLTEVA